MQEKNKFLHKSEEKNENLKENLNYFPEKL